MSEAPRPLSGLRVIEVATGVAAPLAGAVLGSLGADVIKIESRLKPDVNRARVARKGTPLRDAEAQNPEETERFPLLHECNRNKRSITLNLKTAEGLSVFVRLVKGADVLIQNFAPGWLERLGLSIDGLRASNPRLVVLSGSAQGQEGPLKGMRAYAPVMTALAGAESLIGYEDGRIIGMMATAYADMNAAFFSALLVLAQLYGRQEDALGVHLDLSFTAAAVSSLGEALVASQLQGGPIVPRGNASEVAAPHGIYRCAGDDQWIALSVASDEEWLRCRDALAALTGPAAGGRLRCESWSTLSQRIANRTTLDALIGEIVFPHAPEAIARVLQGDGVAASPVLTFDDLATEAYFQERALTQRVPHPMLGEVRVTRIPWYFDGNALPVDAPGPILGGATDAILRNELAMTATEIEHLHSSEATR